MYSRKVKYVETLDFVMGDNSNYMFFTALDRVLRRIGNISAMYM